MKTFIKIRAINAQEPWDIALFRLSSADLELADAYFHGHSVDCWHIARSAQCTCVDASMRNISLFHYGTSLGRSTLFQDASDSRLVEDRRVDVPKDSLYVLQVFLSLSGTSQLATEISPFIPV